MKKPTVKQLQTIIDAKPQYNDVQKAHDLAWKIQAERDRANSLLREAWECVEPDTRWDFDAGGYLYDRIGAHLKSDKFCYHGKDRTLCSFCSDDQKTWTR